MRVARSLQQFLFLAREAQLLVNVHWWRWASIWFTPGFLCVAAYRISRSGYLLMGPLWSVVYWILRPAALLLSPFWGGGRCEIHYKAELGPGLKILHPSLGVVVSGRTVAGGGLTLVGGNCIGGRRKLSAGDLVLGDNVFLGANAVVLGPVHLGNHVVIGAGAVVVADAADNVVLMGVPAEPKTCAHVAKEDE